MQEIEALGAAHRVLTRHASWGSLANALPKLGVLALAGVLLWPVAVFSVDAWSTDEALNFGFLVPPVSALLVWWRRDALRRSVGPGATAGLVGAAGTLAAFLVFERLVAHSPAAVAAGLLLWSMTIYLW